MTKGPFNLITRQRVNKTGLPPGHLDHLMAGNVPVVISLMQFNDQEFKEQQISVAQLPSLMRSDMVSWVNVDGVHNAAIIEEFGRLFKIHPLTLEDIMNTDQRPKHEDYDDYDAVVLKMLYYDEKVKSEQLTIILMNNIVFTFQEIAGKDAFDPVRTRIRSGKGRVRKMGADYLAYALLDSIVDSYFNILDTVGSQIERLDEELTENPSHSTLKALYSLKREMIFLRKAVWPLRELVANLERADSTRISEATGLYLRDVLDHSVRVIETADVYRDMVGGMMDIYHSTLSMRMNEVMKVLTAISTIFIPVTFVAGVYGMNFENMPELRTKWGYPLVMAVMLIIMLTLFIYFKRKRWF